MRSASAPRRPMTMPGTRGVDVDAHAVTGALDLDLGDAGPLHALGEQLADGDVLADVRLVQLVGVPAALVVGRDAETEAVRVDLLAHQAPFPFFFTVLAAATSAGCTARVMWLVRLLIRVARPCARGRQRFIVGPSSTMRDRDDQVVGGEALGGLGVGDGALQHLVDGLGGGLRSELQQGQGLVDGKTADHVDDTAGLHRGDPHEAGGREGARLVTQQGLAAGAGAPALGDTHRRFPFRSSLT